MFAQRIGSWENTKPTQGTLVFHGTPEQIATEIDLTLQKYLVKVDSIALTVPEPGFGQYTAIVVFKEQSSP